MPENNFGKHPAKDGQAYVGVAPIGWYGEIRHITGTLKEPMQKGNNYKVSLYIRFAGDSCRFYVTNFDILFSKNKNPFNKFHIFRFYNDIIKSEIIPSVTFQISNDTSWIKVSGTYTAQGGEKYLILGMFYQDVPDFKEQLNEFFYKELYRKPKKADKFFQEHQDVIKLNPNFKKKIIIDYKKKNWNIGTYEYFIDDVTVELIYYNRL